MEAIPWDHIGIGSGWAFVGLFVWLALTGRLVPKTEHDRSLEHAEHEAQEWRTESRIKDQQIREQEIQLGHLAEVGKTVDAIMRSIHRNARSGDRGSHEEDS
jgi:hypothetical protein